MACYIEPDRNRFGDLVDRGSSRVIRNHYISIRTWVSQRGAPSTDLEDLDDDNR